MAFLLVGLFAVAVILKITDTQFVNGEQWKAIAEDITFQYKTIKATRGNIYSDNGSLLATSLPFYKLAFDATVASDEVFTQGLDSLAYRLSRFFRDKSKESYRRKLADARASGRRYIIINPHKVNYQDKKAMSEWPVFREGRLKGGVIFEKVDVRFRPFNSLSRRTIGFINENNRGAGLEFSFDQYLAGNDGEALFQKIAGGSWIPVYNGTEIKSEDGYDIETTLDVNLQDVTETALMRALNNHEADYGTVVVMEVKTGEIKAISNLSRNKKGHYFERYNHAVGGLEEPGSTFKLATMIALLEGTKIKLSDSIDTGDGEFKFYNNKVRDHHEGGFGKITIREAFEKSSNIAMAKLLDRYFGSDPAGFLRYIDRLALSQPLGFHMIGEGTPKIPRPSDPLWSGITLPWMAYGYGLELTPLQILTLYNAVANEGKAIRPIIVRSVKRADNDIVTFSAEILNKRICSRETLDQLRSIMEGVVERGTASNIRNSHYKIAGKTGTAQILENGKHTKKYITSFAGYFPAHAPKYSAIVVIRNPKGWRQYGSNVAAPVFKEIADNIYARDIEMHQSMSEEFTVEYGVFPVIKGGKQDELQMLCNELGISNHKEGEEDWVKTRVSGNAVKWKDAKFDRELVPDVTGMTLRDAVFILESQGLKVDFKGKGRVTDQSVPPGRKIVKGEKIALQLS